MSEPIQVFSGEPVTLSSVGPWPEVILTSTTFFRGCPIGGCPYLDDEPDVPLTPEQEAALIHVEWVPGVGFVTKK